MADLTLPLLAFLFPLAYSPGPGNMLFAATGARFGLRATAPASLGYHLATWIVTAGLGFGIATALAQAPLLFALLKWAGAAYVLWLALGLWRAGALDAAQEARPMGARDGVVLLLLNPKAYVIILLMFSQFLGPATGPADVVWITTVFTLNNAIAFAVWALIGDRLALRFRDPHQARRLNRGLGVLLAGVAVWMALG
ncbi:LysE family translocator [Pseudodonghicola flavimaris]|uniref:LysE family translocator n=1 Tax=Pseudodonghicola flavimaris TaxID=3050036 RepID=A0ABT7F281_9RHOB|nr:LysE family translocator [Pseudodonghicola flavimaris]MDK3018715.1 LysE family translocator [Pseudodonghicola flavimaris]